MRLIDADALIDVIESTGWHHVSLQGNLVHGARSDIHTPLYKADDIYQALKNAPTINPEDCRPCGRWEEIRNDYGELEGWLHVDCGRESKSKDKYCGTCGAKMAERVMVND